jgi:hypothetical protein
LLDVPLSDSRLGIFKTFDQLASMNQYRNLTFYLFYLIYFELKVESAEKGEFKSEASLTRAILGSLGRVQNLKVELVENEMREVSCVLLR